MDTVLIPWRKFPGSLLFARVFLLAGFFLAIRTQSQEKPILFTNVTHAAGIKFTHFKGNKGTSINLEEFGPGVCVATSTATAGRTSIS